MQLKSACFPAKEPARLPESREGGRGGGERGIILLFAKEENHSHTRERPGLPGIPGGEERRSKKSSHNSGARCFFVFLCEMSPFQPNKAVPLLFAREKKRGEGWKISFFYLLEL